MMGQVDDDGNNSVQGEIRTTEFGLMEQLQDREVRRRSF